MIADSRKIYYGEVKGHMQYIDVKEGPGKRLCPCMIYFTCSYTFNKLGAYSKALEPRYSKYSSVPWWYIVVVWAGGRQMMHIPC